MVPRIAHDLADQTKVDLARWRNHPRLRQLADAWRSDHEYVFCTILIVVIVLLTAWLASHPKASEHPEAPQTPHFIIPVTAPDVDVQVMHEARKSDGN
jgi:hypothetical protein